MRGQNDVDTPQVAIVIEAGDWPPEAELQALAERAVEAAVEVLSRDAASRPSPLTRPTANAEGHPRIKSGAGSLPPGERAGAATELSVVFTNDAAIRELNAKWRGKDSPTNVLSFPQNSGTLLGDVILAAETLRREAALADKPLEDHMAHLIIHGFLHLLGYDHEGEDDAEKMEQIERVALARLGISDPYATPLSP